MESLEGFNIELKRAEEYLDAMALGTANKQDCENVKMHLDNINSIVRNLAAPVVEFCDDRYVIEEMDDDVWEVIQPEEGETYFTGSLDDCENWIEENK